MDPPLPSACNFTLLAAAALLLSSLALAFPLSIDFTGKLNFDPAAPATHYHAMLHAPHPDDGPVAITIDFQIDAGEPREISGADAGGPFDAFAKRSLQLAP